MQWIFTLLLKLYPADYRAIFARQMLAAFLESAEDCRHRGRFALFAFVTAECAGLIGGSIREWFVKWTTPRIERQSWMEGAVADPGERLPGPVADAERRVASLVDQMVYAIAHHDFEGARRYSYQERRERENLRRLRESYGFPGGSETTP